MNNLYCIFCDCNYTSKRSHFATKEHRKNMVSMMVERIVSPRCCKQYNGAECAYLITDVDDNNNDCYFCWLGFKANLKTGREELILGYDLATMLTGSYEGKERLPTKTMNCITWDEGKEIK